MSAAARYATLTACQRATTGRSRTCEEGGGREGGKVGGRQGGGEGRWGGERGEGRGAEGRGGERGGGRGGVFDLKNQGLGFAPGRKKPCYRKSNSS